MKREFAIFILAILLVTATHIVLAEDSSDIDESTRAQVETMNNAPGAKLRMLQLQYDIERKAMHMEQVISYLDEQGKETTELKGILEELNLLADETKTIQNTDANVIEKFVQIKKDATDLISEFRTKAGALITAEDKQAIRDRFNDEGLEQLKEQVKEQRRLINAEKTRAALGAIEVEDEGFVNQVREGTLTEEQVKERLREHYAEAQDEQKLRLREELQNRLEQEKEQVQARVQEYIQNKAESIQQRIQERAQKLESEASEYAKNRASRLRGEDE